MQDKIKRFFNNKRNIWGLICLLITVLIVIFIFSRSLKPGEDSIEESKNMKGILNGILSFLGIDSEFGEYFVRKLAHFTEFACLGFFAYLSTFLLSKVKKTLIYFLISAPFSLAVASIDETIQLFVDGRTGKITDVLIDFSGSLTGILMIFLIILIIISTKKKKVIKNS